MTGSTPARTPYARHETRTGHGNEYDYSTADYEVGVCDTCQITDEYIGRVGRGWGPINIWIRRHNQQRHQEATRPDLAASAPAVHVAVTLTCGYVHPEPPEPRTPHQRAMQQMIARSTPPGSVCGRSLSVYDNGWDYGRPLYVCGAGHLVEIPTELDRRAAGRELSGQMAAIVERGDLVRERFELDARQRDPAERERRA